MHYGMFICWSFSAFSGTEWADPAGKEASFTTNAFGESLNAQIQKIKG